MKKTRKEFMTDQEWPPNGRWLSLGDSGTRRSDQGLEKSVPSRGRPALSHPVLNLIQRSLESKRHLLGPVSRERFKPFHKEFAMLFLAGISPHVSLRVMKTAWPSGSASGKSPTHPLGKVSIRTIQNVYRRVATDIRSGNLVASLPISWIRELKKHNMGPWSESVPEWMNAAFRKGCKHVELPKSGPTTTSIHPAMDAGLFPDQSKALEGRNERGAQLDDIARQIQDLKVVAPGFELVADKLLVVWNGCLSEIRKVKEELRGKEPLEDAANADSTVDLPQPSNQTDAEQESHNEAEDISIFDCVDVQNDAGTARPIESDRKQVSILIPAWNGLSITDETTTKYGETSATSKSSPTSIRRKWRTDLLGLSEKELGDSWQNESKIFNPSTPNREVRAPDLTFPRLKSTDPRMAFDEWRHFGGGYHSEIESKPGIAGWIPKAHDGILRLAIMGFTHEALYGSLGNRFPESLTLCWLIERIIARVLYLEIDAALDDINDPYLPKTGNPSNVEVLKWEHLGYNRGAFPITPLLIESLSPVMRFRRPPDHEWIPGWGFLPEFEEQKAREFLKGLRRHSASGTSKPTCYEQWARAIVLAGDHRDSYDCLCKIKKLRSDYKGFLPMPMCTDYRKATIPTVEWLDLSKVKGLWRSEAKEDSAIVQALKGFTTAIHMPTVHLLDSFYRQRALAYFG